MANASPPDPITPDAVARMEFDAARRGYDSNQVRGFLRQVAGELHATRQREVELARRLQGAQEAADQAPRPTLDDLDDDELTGLLSEKTTQVLDAARSAAADITERAKEKAARLVEAANEDAARQRNEAERTLRAARDQVSEVETKAERKARDLLQTAEGDVSRIRGEAEQVMGAARTQAAEIERDSDAKALATTSEADEQAARARAKSETMLTTARTDAKARLTETETRAAALLADAASMAARTRKEADDVLGVRSAEAQSAADAILAHAERQAAARIDAGGERGRELVDEADRTRERVLRELSSTRRIAHEQIEQLRIGRERLLQAYAVVRATADQATGDLDDSLGLAQEAAQKVVDRMGDDDDLDLAQLEASFAIEPMRDLAILAEDPLRAEADEDSTGEIPTADERASDQTRAPDQSRASEPRQASDAGVASANGSEPAVDLTEVDADTAEVDSVG